MTGCGRWRSAIDGMLLRMRGASTRLLHLLALLTSRPRWSGAQLADALGVTERTVRRDVGRLRSLDYPVHAVPGPAGGYRLGAGGRLPPLLLDTDEAVAVAVCLRAGAAGTVAGIDAAAARALSKLEQFLPIATQLPVDAIGRAVVTLGGPSDAPVDADVLLECAQACRARERLRFDYQPRDGERRRRLVEPFRLVQAGRRWYLVAWDVGRGGWRTLRVDRISHVRATGQPCTHADEPDAASMVSHAVSTAPYRRQARVRLHAPLDEVARYVPPTVGVLTPDGDGCVLTTGAHDLTVIAAHLAMLDVAFTVLDPPELRGVVATMAARLASAT